MGILIHHTPLLLPQSAALTAPSEREPLLASLIEGGGTPSGVTEGVSGGDRENITADLLYLKTLVLLDVWLHIREQTLC